MSLFRPRAQRLFGVGSVADLIPRRGAPHPSNMLITSESAMRYSAVWACLRLRADLLSTMPVDVYRNVGSRRIEVPKPPVLVSPGGDVGIVEWLYSSQVDLDRVGNAIGVITERDGRDMPARIELQSADDTTVRVRDGRITKYLINRTEYNPVDIWHEKQFTLPGLHVGLSPVAYAAWSIGEYLSAQQFALAWFEGGGVPNAHMKNTQVTLAPGEAVAIKERFKASVRAGEPLVTGSDWDYNLIEASGAQWTWLEGKHASDTDVARFFGVPSDLIDAAPTTARPSVTYANITQRNLQLLIMHMGPAIVRREDKFTRDLLGGPRYCKFNESALLRMDPQARADTLAAQINSRVLAPSEARQLDDRAPFTEQQMAEFDRLFGTGAAVVAQDVAPTGAAG